MTEEQQHPEDENEIIAQRRAKLAELRLRGNRIREAGGLALARALASNTTLDDLCMKYNPVGEAASVALVSAAGASTTLLSLNVCTNQGGECAVRSLRRGR